MTGRRAASPTSSNRAQQLQQQVQPAGGGEQSHHTQLSSSGKGQRHARVQQRCCMHTTRLHAARHPPHAHGQAGPGSSCSPARPACPAGCHLIRSTPSATHHHITHSSPRSSALLHPVRMSPQSPVPKPTSLVLVAQLAQSCNPTCLTAVTGAPDSPTSADTAWHGAQTKQQGQPAAAGWMQQQHLP
jgi:hypothetical protein